MMEKSEIFTLDFSFLQKELKNETKFISKSFELKLESFSLIALQPKKKKNNPHTITFSQIHRLYIYSLQSQENEGTKRHANPVVQ